MIWNLLICSKPSQKLKLNKGRKMDHFFFLGMKFVNKRLLHRSEKNECLAELKVTGTLHALHIVFLQKSNYQSPNFSYFQYKYIIFLYYCKK